MSPGALDSEDLDDFAKLSAQLDTQKAISDMLMEIASKPLFQSNTAKSALYGKYGNVIPYAM